MKASSRYYENIYWSWRRFLKSAFPNVLRFYNPSVQPMPEDADSWIIFFTGGYDSRRFANSAPRIVCVAKDDDRKSVLDGLAGDVAEACGPTHVSRFVDLYDETTEAVVGRIEVTDVSIRQAVPYATGISSRAVDFFTIVKTARNR